MECPSSQDWFWPELPYSMTEPFCSPALVSESTEFGESWQEKEMFVFALDLSISTGQSQFFSASQDRQMENDLSPHQKLNHFDALPELQRLLRVLVSWENS